MNLPNNYWGITVEELVAMGINRDENGFFYRAGKFDKFGNPERVDVVSIRTIAENKKRSEYLNAIECPDCRKRAEYDLDHELWENSDRTEPKPTPPNVPNLKMLSHDEFECPRCKNIIVIPDL